jgi:excisionase family DNA binding protein
MSLALREDQLERLADLIAERVGTVRADAESVAAQRGALVDTKQAAELLGVPESWLRTEVRHERVPFVRLGPKYVRFEPDVLMTWWRGHRRGPAGS